MVCIYDVSLDSHRYWCAHLARCSGTSTIGEIGNCSIAFEEGVSIHLGGAVDRDVRGTKCDSWLLVVQSAVTAAQAIPTLEASVRSGAHHTSCRYCFDSHRVRVSTSGRHLPISNIY